MTFKTIQRFDFADPNLEHPYLRQAKSQIDETPRSSVAVDLAGVQGISSADLNVLIALHGKLRSGGRELVLVNVAQPLRDILELTRLDRLFRIESDPSMHLI
jgi:anti-anti-sigma factor